MENSRKLYEAPKGTIMEWTNFGDLLPDDLDSYYITDYINVWVRDFTTVEALHKYAENYPEFSWAKIALPEVPKKKEEHWLMKEDLTKWKRKEILHLLQQLWIELRTREDNR